MTPEIWVDCRLPGHRGRNDLAGVGRQLLLVQAPIHTEPDEDQDQQDDDDTQHDAATLTLLMLALDLCRTLASYGFGFPP
jgi:hypothetical protein